MSQQSGKLMPNLDQQSTKILNLTVFQRIDPFVEEILITAAPVTFYEFNVELNQWSRKDVEGSLFVVKRNTQPRFQFIVMNRRNTDNLVENLLGDFEFEVQVPYLLYRSANQEVNGIWFYNSRECEDVATLFSRILNAYSKVPPKSNVSSDKREFEELEAVPSLAVMEGPLEPTSLTSSVGADIPDDSHFMNYFSAAVNIGNPSDAAIAKHLHQPPAATPLSSHTPSVLPSCAPSLPSPISSSPLRPHLDTPDPSSSSSKHAANLVKPSSFFFSSSPPLTVPQLSSSTPILPPLHPPVNLQRPYGTPMLQPFPPPTPPPSLTPTAAPTLAPNYGHIISRDKVREALVKVLQKEQFIDMFYQELLNAHYS